MENPETKAAISRMREPGNILEELAREGARRLLPRALENEVAEFIAEHQGIRDSEGR